MLLSAVSVLVVAQTSSEIPEGLMNNPVYEQHRPTGRARKQGTKENIHIGHCTRKDERKANPAGRTGGPYASRRLRRLGFYEIGT